MPAVAERTVGPIAPTPDGASHCPHARRTRASCDRVDVVNTCDTGGHQHRVLRSDPVHPLPRLTAAVFTPTAHRAALHHRARAVVGRANIDGGPDPCDADRRHFDRELGRFFERDGRHAGRRVHVVVGSLAVADLAAVVRAPTPDAAVGLQRATMGLPSGHGAHLREARDRANRPVIVIPVADPELPPVVASPAAHAPGLGHHAAARRADGQARTGLGPLVAAFGRQRAGLRRVLAAIAPERTLGVALAGMRAVVAKAAASLARVGFAVLGTRLGDLARIADAVAAAREQNTLGRRTLGARHTRLAHAARRSDLLMRERAEPRFRVANVRRTWVAVLARARFAGRAGRRCDGPRRERKRHRKRLVLAVSVQVDVRVERRGQRLLEGLEPAELGERRRG